jgi:hypothetical protein
MDAGHDPDDVVELGSREPGSREPGGSLLRLPGGWRPSRRAGILAAAALAVGLAAGYVAGYRHTTAAAPRVTATVTVIARPGPSGSGPPAPATAFPFADSSALIQDVASCSIQTGHELQLGVQVSNESSDAITLRTMRAVLPLGGLKPLAHVWGPCGSLHTGMPGAGTGVLLQPGATTWLTVTVRVQVPCPAPMPVQFSVGYLVGGHPFTTNLPGFPDLVGVPYSGCKSGTQIAIN